MGICDDKYLEVLPNLLIGDFVFQFNVAIKCKDTCTSPGISPHLVFLDSSLSNVGEVLQKLSLTPCEIEYAAQQ